MEGSLHFDLDEGLWSSQPINLSGISNEQALAWYENMFFIRQAEFQIAEGRKEGIIKGPVHLGVGQEAIAVGVSQHLVSKDYVFGAHRSHAHLLGLSQNVYGLFAEVLGRSDGVSRGMGGSMHLIEQDAGFYGSVPIVAGTVPIAVGAGMALNLQGLNNIAVVYFGDGACEEGVVHEAFNLAKTQNANVLFVVENNLFASHMHITQRQPFTSTVRFGWANNIPAYTVDGNDVVKVSKAVDGFVKSVRSGGGPRLLEAVTYRWFGHVDWREDVDVGVCRSEKDIAAWRERDPLNRLRLGLIDSHPSANNEIEDLEKKVLSVIKENWQRALLSPQPPHSSIFDHVYS